LAGVSELLDQAVLIAAVIMLQIFVDFLELCNHKLQASYNVLLGVCGNDVLKHYKSSFINVKLVVFRGMKINVCACNHFQKNKILAIDIMVIKITGFAFKHNAISFVIAFSGNSDHPTKTFVNLNFLVKHIVEFITKLEVIVDVQFCQIGQHFGGYRYPVVLKLLGSGDLCRLIALCGSIGLRALGGVKLYVCVGLGVCLKGLYVGLGRSLVCKLLRFCRS
jgi:hypothetical protein